MMIKFIICAAVLMSAGSAYGVKTPSDAEIDDIQKQIYAANKMDKQIGDAEQAARDAEKINASEAQILELERKVEREKDKQRAARTKAIHMTITAYGLKPVRNSGKSVMPSTKGRDISWMPLAREPEAHTVRNAAGDITIVKQEKTENYGITYMDGVTIMDLSAFLNGPGFLASYLLHERIHFEQITTEGEGNAKSYAELQKAAYKAQVDNANHFFNSKNDPRGDLQGEIKRRFSDQSALVALEEKERKTLKGRIRRLLPRPAPPNFFDAKIHTNAELADISGLVSQARSQAEMARLEREEREAIKLAAAEKSAHRANDERLKQIIGELALRSCADPGSVTQDELDRLPLPSREDFYHGKLPSGLEGADGTGYCVEPYQYMGLWAGKPPDAEKVRMLSMQTKRINVQPQPPAEAVQPTQQTPIARQPAPPPFSDAFPLLNEFALEACRAPEQVAISSFLTQRYDFSNRAYDDELARKYAAGLGGCPGQLFNQLLAMMRAGNVYVIDRQWIRSKVAEAGGGSSRGRPRYGGPDQNHPIIVFPKPPW